MQTVEIYTRATCGYCHAAKRLLVQKGVKFAETDIDREPTQRPVMIRRANGRSTVPQIFIGGKHVGGSDDLHLLDRQGKLDQLLAG